MTASSQPTKSDAGLVALTDYRDAFSKMWDNRSPRQVPNEMPDHAAALFDVFLAKASQTVTIYCKNLSKEVFGRLHLVQRLESAIQRNVRFRVVCQESPNPSLFLTTLLNHREMCEVGVIKDIQTVDPVALRTANFACVDGRAFRYEPDSGVPTAIACAWNRDVVADLEALFATLKSKSEQVAG